MAEPRLHLDADASSRALLAALAARGHDVSRTPNEWIAENASDEDQLLAASARGRVIFSFNIGDFSRLGAHYSDHAGIILAVQQDWPIASLISALDRLLTETSAGDWRGQVRWLNDWR